jgi:integrase
MRREGSTLRIADRRRAEFDRHVLPTLGARPVGEIKRSEIVALLDRIEDNSGPGAAHTTLAHISKLFSWHAARSDDFRSPIVRGMGRLKSSDSARDRVLSDEELQVLWSATAEGGPFDRYIRFLLLTATRRNEAANATRAEVAGDIWTIPSERYKTGVEHVVPLSPAALALLAGVRTRATAPPYFFGPVPIIGFSRRKAELDRASGVGDWVLHDLRRTARSLMSRAGVSADIAERCLGHVIPGVRGVYDRHEYLDEKRQAFEALAAQIERIMNPQPNVVAIGTKR